MEHTLLKFILMTSVRCEVGDLGQFVAFDELDSKQL